MLSFQTTLTAACDGNSNTNWGCCSISRPCDIGGGDCDNNSDCKGDLVCGKDNCKDDYSSASSNWDSAADCCIVRKYIHINVYAAYACFGLLVLT